MILTLLLLVILAVCVAMLHQEGLWGNTIRLINVVTAGLLATNCFEPLANTLQDYLPRHDLYLDFVALWGLFTLFLALMRLATELASRTVVQFLPLVDRIGGPLMAATVGWVMVCFTLMSLHMAPLSGRFLYGSFQPEKPMFLGMAPDRLWLGFVQRLSLGAFSRGASPTDPEEHVFDRDGLFLPKYASRRAALDPKPKNPVP